MARAKIYKLRASNININKIHRLIILLIIIALAVIWTSAPTLRLIKERKQSSILQQQLSNNRAENKDLRKDIKNLKTDPYIELRARNDLGLVKPNEIQYYVLTKKIKPKAKPRPKPKTWWQRTLDYLEMMFSK